MLRIPVRLLLAGCFALLFLNGIKNPVTLQAAFDRMNADSALKHGAWGVCVLTADSGKMVAAYNAEQSLIPASTLKILTTGAAIGLLGENYRYVTTIEHDGIFDTLNGIIRGSVYLRGSGDPTFDSKYFRKGDTIGAIEKLPLRLKQLGVKRIEGDIIGDASCFSDNPVPDGWTWSDIGQYYGAGTSGLAYRDNAVTLYFNSTQGDSAVLEKVIPRPDGVNYRSFVTTGGKKDNAFVYGAPFGNTYYIYGTIPPGRKDYEVDAAHPEPALQCAADYLAGLKKAGIVVTGKATTIRRMEMANENIKLKRKSLSAILSPTLAEIVRETNLHSDNVYAEQLLRTLGKVKGAAGSTEEGVRVVKNYWQSLGIPIAGLNMTDGNGLSRSNTVTTKIQAMILQKISTMSWSAVFEQSLPIAGRSGSLASLCKGTCAENNLTAKSGYINRARGYAGYVKTQSGKKLCFSIIANNYTCSATEMKKKIEKILVTIAELP
ncbi:MAG TPA: D-alanyl-D-alanine carboxypeptidase/D-alanyl-D-alanine-endopeptidase [Bacteroidia bacterium]|nr:D-alanyl-D-alanine carboxypeptidase/D-alanyl-D-alanine-endopeptidase [Bacteroidia bacterium]